MEIIVQILLEILLWAVQFFAEVILQIFGEALFELLGQSLKKRGARRAPLSPVLAAAGCLLCGALAGAASLWLFPRLFIETGWLRAANLVLTPLAAGAVMAGIGAWRQKNGQETIRLDTFAYGFSFALSMALVRFFFAAPT